jgi:hypothetical protein
MNIEEYDSTLQYNIGDICWRYNYYGEQNEDGELQILYFICIKRHPPNAAGNYQPIIPNNYFPNDPNYPKWLEPQAWEMIWPEWSAEVKYGLGDFVTHNGYYYKTSWRWVVTIDYERIDEIDYNASEPGDDRQLNNELPPSENEDEHNVRAWFFSAERQFERESSFGLFPYHLERHFHDSIYDVKCPHPYYHPRYGIGEYFFGTNDGLGFGYRKHGFSFECFQDYDDWYGYDYDDEGIQVDQNGDETIDEDDEVLVYPGGIAEANECGVGLQHQWAGGICWGAGIAAWKDDPPPYGTQTMWAWVGSTQPAPDGNPPFQQTEYTKENATGKVFYNFNHPMFFRRSMEVTIGIETALTYYKARKNQDGVIVYYSAEAKWNIYKVTKTFNPKNDCFSTINIPGSWFEILPEKNVVGKFLLPMGDMRRSYPFTYNQKWTPWFPYVKVEKDD